MPSILLLPPPPPRAHSRPILSTPLQQHHNRFWCSVTGFKGGKDYIGCVPNSAAASSSLALSRGHELMLIPQNDPQLVEAYDEKLWKDYV